jgi:hypothetical protein
MRIERAAFATAFLLVSMLASSARADDAATEMRSPAVFGVGLSLTGLGIGGVIAGGALLSSGMDACDGISRDEVPKRSQIDACQSGVNEQLGGVVGLVTGGAFLLGGLPLIFVGASSTEVEPQPVVDVSVGPLSGSLRVRF